jgi:hypothetical protein
MDNYTLAHWYSAFRIPHSAFRILAVLHTRTSAKFTRVQNAQE